MAYTVEVGKTTKGSYSCAACNAGESWCDCIHKALTLGKTLLGATVSRNGRVLATSKHVNAPYEDHVSRRGMYGGGGSRGAEL
jgi:hypothetical protein